MQLPTQAQIDAVKRYAITVVTTVMGFAGIASLLARYGIDSKGLVDTINGIGDVFTASLALAGVVGTLLTTLRGFHAASPTRQVESLKQTMASSGTSAETKQQMLAGAVDTVAVAASAPEPEVAKAAKVAILDTAGSLPEVPKPIEVNDRSLAAATGDNVKLAT